MKKIILAFGLVASLTIFASCNDDSQDLNAASVPTAVTSTFANKYAGATEVEWEKEIEDGKTIYEAEFTFNGAEMKAKFDGNGTMIESEGD